MPMTVGEHTHEHLESVLGQPLTSSYLVSSAIALAGQYEGPRRLLRGPSTFRGAMAPPCRSGRGPEDYASDSSGS